MRPSLPHEGTSKKTMTLDSADFQDLEIAIGERIYLQIAKWRLSLGDAGVAKELAIECCVHLDKGSQLSVKKALEAFQIQVGGGESKMPLGLFLTSSQIKELEEILDPYCR